MLPLFFDPPLDELTAPFWEGFERHQIVLPRCSGCGRFQWYPEAAGPDCPGADYSWVAVPTTGTLSSKTRVHRAFLPGAAGSLPFTVGFVELDGADGLRLVANVDDQTDVAIGDRVEARFQEVAGRWPPVFHPVTG
jgi:uncharacterized OB-fold protein